MDAVSLSGILLITIVAVFVMVILDFRNKRKKPIAPLKPHEWRRADQGGELARRMVCNCGFVVSGYSWKDIQNDMDVHDAVILTEYPKCDA